MLIFKIMKMKTLKFLLCASIASVALTSCLGNDDDGGQTVPDTILRGIEIHNIANGQSIYAIDPVNIAFRLNALLTDKQLQDAPTLEDVRTESGNGEKTYLFGGTRIEENYNGVEGDYRLTFEMAGTQGQYDRRRDGSVIIKTGGKLLTDLAASGGVWVVDFSDAQKLRYFYSNTESITVESADDYIIKAEDGGYVVEMKNFKSYVRSNLASSWTGMYTVKPDTDDLLSMKYLKKSIFKVGIYTSGKSMFDLGGKQPVMRMETTRDFAYKPEVGMRDGSVFKYDGSVNVTISGDYDQKLYPSNFVIVEYKANGSVVAAIITYNGQTFTL